MTQTAPIRSTPARADLARRGGFTLVELALAAALLTVALVLLANGTDYVRLQGRTAYTRDLLASADRALAAYRDLHDVWPADRFTRNTIQPTETHQPRTEGIECLVRTLGAAGFWAGTPFAASLANVDDDRNRNDLAPLWELVDGWGRPLLYYHAYSSAPTTQPTALPDFGGLGEARLQRLNKALKDRWLAKGGAPLLDSAGPDGVFNNTDDVRMVGRPSDDDAAAGDLP